MKKEDPLVTIVIPTKNSNAYLKKCLESIRLQTYRNAEVLIIDSASKDQTRETAASYGAQVLDWPMPGPGTSFEATAKRNHGARLAHGKYIYYLDADMEVSPNVLSDAVGELENGKDAIIIPEESFGTGIWARAKNLERRCYRNERTVEAPRMIRTDAWRKVGGLDEKIGGGGDDWDLHHKLQEHNYRIGRIQALVFHNEGDLSLSKLLRKRFLYGRDVMKYIKKRPKESLKAFFPLRKAYLRNWKLFIPHPIDSMAFIVMRTTEYMGGFAGIIYSLISKK